VNKALTKYIDKERVLETKDIFDSIVEILKDKKETALLQIVAECNYNKEAWSEYQADKLGTIRTLSELITLLEVKNG